VPLSTMAGKEEMAHLIGFFIRVLRVARVRLHPSGRGGKADEASSVAAAAAVDSGEAGVGGNAADERGVRKFFFGVSNVVTVGVAGTATGVPPSMPVAAAVPGVGGVASRGTGFSASASSLVTTGVLGWGREDSVTSEFGFASFFT
jgi:hypothetical protein